METVIYLNNNNIYKRLLCFLLILLIVVNSFMTNYIEAEASAIALSATAIYYAKALIAAGLLAGVLYYGTSPRPLEDGDVFEIPNSVDKKVRGKVVDFQKYLSEKQKVALSFVSDPDPNKKPPKNFTENEKNVLNTIKETGKLTWEFFKTFGLVAFIGSILNLYNKELYLDESFNNSEYVQLLSKYSSSIYKKPANSIQTINYYDGFLFLHSRDGHLIDIPISKNDDVVRFYTDNFRIETYVSTLPNVVTTTENDRDGNYLQFYSFKYPEREDGSYLRLSINVPLYGVLDDNTLIPNDDNLKVNRFLDYEINRLKATYTMDNPYMFGANSDPRLSYTIPTGRIEIYDSEDSLIETRRIRWYNSAYLGNYRYTFSFLKMFEQFEPVYKDFYGEDFLVNLVDVDTFKGDYGVSMPFLGVKRDFFDIQFGVVYDNIPSYELDNFNKEITKVIEENYTFDRKIKEDAKELPAPVIDVEIIQDIAQQAEQEYSLTGDISLPLFVDDTVELKEDVSINLDLNGETGLITVDNVEPIGDIIQDVDTEPSPDPDNSGLLGSITDLLNDIKTQIDSWMGNDIADSVDFDFSPTDNLNNIDGLDPKDTKFDKDNFNFWDFLKLIPLILIMILLYFISLLNFAVALFAVPADGSFIPEGARQVIIFFKEYKMLGTIPIWSFISLSLNIIIFIKIGGVLRRHILKTQGERDYNYEDLTPFGQKIFYDRTHLEQIKQKRDEYLSIPLEDRIRNRVEIEKRALEEKLNSKRSWDRWFKL